VILSAVEAALLAFIGGLLARGVLMIGGSFTDLPNFDPLVARVLTDDQALATEPPYSLAQFFPGQLAKINRFARIDGTLTQRLVVVPAQYKAVGPSPGIERRYDSLSPDRKVLLDPMGCRSPPAPREARMTL
jgi:hypothetical protein